jgi:hypothetical protein
MLSKLSRDISWFRLDRDYYISQKETWVFGLLYGDRWFFSCSLLIRLGVQVSGVRSVLSYATAI